MQGPIVPTGKDGEHDAKDQAGELEDKVVLYINPLEYVSVLCQGGNGIIDASGHRQFIRRCTSTLVSSVFTMLCLVGFVCICSGK